MADDRFRAVLEDTLILGVAVINPAPPVQPPRVGSVTPSQVTPGAATTFQVSGQGLGSTSGARLDRVGGAPRKPEPKPDPGPEPESAEHGIHPIEWIKKHLPLGAE